MLPEAAGEGALGCLGAVGEQDGDQGPPCCGAGCGAEGDPCKLGEGSRVQGKAKSRDRWEGLRPYTEGGWCWLMVQPTTFG